MSFIPFKLAVSAEMVFIDLPFIERVKRIHALGFSVEIWNWASKDIQALAATGADFTSMTGYLSGNLTDPEAIRQLLDSAQESLAVAAQLGCPSLNLHGTGLDAQGLPVKPVAQATGRMWLSACKTLEKSPAWAKTRVGYSCWKTSIPQSTTPARRSPALTIPWR